MSKHGSVIGDNWRQLLPSVFAACVSGNEVVRYRLDRPFVRGEFVYATDGRVCVRMSTPDGLEIDGAEQGPVTEALRWDGTGGETRYRVPAKLDLLPRSSCKSCGGKHKCETCDGSGESERGECGCADCDGSGVCWHCEDDGLAPQEYRVFVPRAMSVGICERYARVLADAGAEWIAGTNGELHSPFRFEVGEVVGLVMPRKADAKSASLLVELEPLPTTP